MNDKQNTLKQISEKILSVCETPNAALKAIHLIVQHGGAGELAWQVVYNRVMADDDVEGAYYLASFAQKVHDLPFDAMPLVQMVLEKGDENTKAALLDKLPVAAKEQLAAEGLLPVLADAPTTTQ